MQDAGEYKAIKETMNNAGALQDSILSSPKRARVQKSGSACMKAIKDDYKSNPDKQKFMLWCEATEADMQGGIREYEKLLQDLSKFSSHPMVAQQFVDSVKKAMEDTRALFAEIVKHESTMKLTPDDGVNDAIAESDEMVLECDAHMKKLAASTSVLVQGKQLVKLLVG